MLFIHSFIGIRNAGQDTVCGNYKSGNHNKERKCELAIGRENEEKVDTISRRMKNIADGKGAARRNGGDQEQSDRLSLT